MLPPSGYANIGDSYVDNSIMKCMVQQIRNAKQFIYMENQYFMGSAFQWQEDSSINCHNLVPIEIAYRIVENINQRKMFTAYIVIPMYPEGDPTSMASQEILFWQYRTIESMYTKIAEAIQRNGSSMDPTDYLRFFCLAKRESPDEIPVRELSQPFDESMPAKIRYVSHARIYIFVILLPYLEYFVITLFNLSYAD